MALPQFLVIGAQKAGTTWLHHHLRRNEQVWLPPIKELHYFDRGQQPLIGDILRDRRARFMLRRWLKVGLEDLRHHPGNLAWHLRFFASPRSDGWYRKCFAKSGARLAGEVCPAYARLSDPAVSRVAELLPDATIIYVLRNPLDRMWSQAAMYFSRYGHSGLSHASAAEIHHFLSWDIAQANNAYSATIARWQSHFLSHRFHVLFYDQLADDPAGFMAKTCDILGIEPRTDTDFTLKIHAGAKVAIPSEIRARMCAEYRPEIERLHAIFDNEYTSAWLTSLDP